MPNSLVKGRAYYRLYRLKSYPWLARRDVRGALLLAAFCMVFWIVPGQSSVLTADRVLSRPDILMRMNEQDVKKILGYPMLMRNESPAEIWQYHGKNCVLDLVFYPVQGRKMPQVEDYQLRSREAEIAELSLQGRQDCLAELMSYR